MARGARFTISAIADLLEQLRYAPVERRRHDMVAAEAFLNEIVEDQNYPEDFVVFRITEYRPEVGEPAVLVGRALWCDLAVFVERLSFSLALTFEDYERGVPLTLVETRERLGVSSTTLHRYRKLGLVAHQVVDPDGKMRLGFFEDAIVKFEQRNVKRVGKARTFTKIGEEEKARMIRRARRYAVALGYTRQQVTQRLAKRFGRSAEAVRQLLKRHDDEQLEATIFGRTRKKLTVREQRLLLRADRLGIPMSKLTARFGRTRPTLYRAVHQARAAALLGWQIAYVELPTFEIEEADEFLLASDLVRKGFVVGGYGGHFGGVLAPTWVELVEGGALDVEEAEETAWFGALNYLLYQAARLRKGLDRHHAAATQIDLIETKLRWAVALKQRIMAANVRAVLATLEIHLGDKLLTARRDDVLELQTLGMVILAESVDQFDPARGQRFGVLLSLNLRKALARLTPEEGGGQVGKARAKRSGARHGQLWLAGQRSVTRYPWEGVLTFSAERCGMIGEMLADAKVAEAV